MINLCEACEGAPATIMEACDDPAEPYLVCAQCHQRLLHRALRPREWFGLAKRHGWDQYLLHDDFYDQDGTADQPVQPVASAAVLPAPTLSDCRSTPSRLLEFTITRWQITPDLILAWKALPPRETLQVLMQRFSSTPNAGIRATTLEIAAEALGLTAAAFVRTSWRSYPQFVSLGPLAHASACCLPFDESFPLVLRVMDGLDSKARHEHLYCLAFFHSPHTLDWLERSVSTPVAEAWGRLAAQSQLSWSRVRSWLERGRPLSLVALDALVALLPPSYPTPQWAPRDLNDAPSRSEFEAVLNTNAALDPVPRVTRLTTLLIARSKEVLQRA